MWYRSQCYDRRPSKRFLDLLAIADEVADKFLRPACACRRRTE